MENIVSEYKKLIAELFVPVIGGSTMSSQTSLVAKQCRLQTWALQIQECQNRPKDMSVDDWCLQHNITKTNYYYRLRRVREACLVVLEYK